MARKSAPPDDAYARKKETERLRQAAKSKAGREIAHSCPKCKCPKTRAKILKSLRFALVTLFKEQFPLEFGPDHDELIKDIENAIVQGDQAARAMPRGTGKTTILVCAVIWAILTGRHKFVALVAANVAAAEELLEDITTLFETNEQLLEYFPELIWPIRKLEGVRQKRLLWEGKPIRQQWKKKVIILPSVPGAPGESAIIKAAGILGRIRGMNVLRPNGDRARPSLVLIDDPQTDDSARSEKQTTRRVKVICETIPGLAGPGVKISVLMACTVIYKDDLADQMLSREKHPEWRGKRKALLRKIPTDIDLWNEYAEILRDCMRKDEPITRATKFYVEHQDAMDAGGEPSWLARFNPDEASAIQYAMNIKILSPSRFASEYQNCPLVLIELESQTDADQVIKRLSGRARGVIPVEVETLAFGVDVQKNYLVYTGTGFATDATPYVVDYGTYPDQKIAYFDRRGATRTIAREFPKFDPKAQLWKALDALIIHLMAIEFKREDGVRIGIKKIAIDVRYQGDVVKKYARQSSLKDILLPAQGIAIAPGAAGINEKAAKPGEISKNDFRLPPLGLGQVARTVSFDSAEYISKVHDALNTPMGSPGAMTIFTAESHLHRCFVDQLCAEYSETITVRGRPKRVWKEKPDGGDNDFLDSTKLSFVAGYVAGVEPNFGAKRPKSDKSSRREPRYAML